MNRDDKGTRRASNSKKSDVVLPVEACWAITNDGQIVTLDGQLAIYRDKGIADRKRQSMFPATFKVVPVDVIINATR